MLLSDFLLVGFFVLFLCVLLYALYKAYKGIREAQIEDREHSDKTHEIIKHKVTLSDNRILELEIRVKILEDNPLVEKK